MSRAWGCSMPKYAKLTGDLVRRGVTMRTTRIIGPDGEFTRVVTPVEADVPAEYRPCIHCGHTIAVDKI
jgi:hypothetical protein